MPKDLDALGFIMSNKGTVGLTIGQSAFDYYAGIAAYKERKKTIKAQEDTLRIQAELEKAGIQRNTYLTQQTIKERAIDNDTQLMKAGAQEVQGAAMLGAAGSALSMIAQNESAKRARQAARTEGDIEDTVAEGALKVDQVDVSTEQRVNNLWGQLGNKPSVLESVIKTTTQVYKAYKDEVTDRAKTDALMGAGKFGSSHSSEVKVKSVDTSAITTPKAVANEPEQSLEGVPKTLSMSVQTK